MCIWVAYLLIRWLQFDKKESYGNKVAEFTGVGMMSERFHGDFYKTQSTVHPVGKKWIILLEGRHGRTRLSITFVFEESVTGWPDGLSYKKHVSC